MREWFLEQLAVYAAYHRNRLNQATHHIGVPLIVYSLLLASSQFHVATISFGQSILYLPLSSLLLTFLLLFYLINEMTVGLIATLIYCLIYVAAEYVSRSMPTKVWSVFLFCFISGWVIQFVGHVFEGRRPAFFSNALQIFMAPPFLIAEILFAFKRHKKLQHEIIERSAKYNQMPKVE